MSLRSHVITLAPALLASVIGCTIQEAAKNNCVSSSDCLAGRACVSSTCVDSDGATPFEPPDGTTPDAVAPFQPPDGMTPDAVPPFEVPDGELPPLPGRPVACNDTRSGQRVYFLSPDHVRTAIAGQWAFCSDGALEDAANPETAHVYGVDILVDQQWAILARDANGGLTHKFGWGVSGVYQILDFPALPPPVDGRSDAGFLGADGGASPGAETDARFEPSPEPDSGPVATPDGGADAMPSSGSVVTLRFGDGIHSVSVFESPPRLVIDGVSAVPVP